MSLITRRTCLRPFLGGITFSTASENKIRPTRSLLAIAEKAIWAAISAQISALLRGRNIHHQHHRELALLGEHLHEHVVHPRGHVPVDNPDLVSGLVLAHLRKRHPPPLEDRVVLPGEEIGHHLARGDLQLADALDEVLRKQAAAQGTSTRSKTR